MKTLQNDQTVGFCICMVFDVERRCPVCARRCALFVFDARLSGSMLRFLVFKLRLAIVKIASRATISFLLSPFVRVDERLFIVLVLSYLVTGAGQQITFAKRKVQTSSFCCMQHVLCLFYDEAWLACVGVRFVLSFLVLNRSIYYVVCRIKTY